VCSSDLENGIDVTKSNKLFLIDSNKGKKFKIKSASRVGIKQGLEKKWRFYVKDNEYIST
jgi:3-methyladenine DNA glycosylase Mpg